MSISNGFTIYNASAGSGKTFTVVKNYLKILLQSKNPLAFKSVLALTFTNKAVGEMKERIIFMLKSFSDPNIIEQNNKMFSVLVQELDIEPEVLHIKSKSILNTLLHNYASFDISTIDKFNHKLIRTFTYDLNLPLNFEVELDSIEVLNRAVDKLIDKAGTDKELTKVLVDFAIEKADEDKSWDIAYDFNNIAKLWIDENQIPYLKTIKDKSLDDFKRLKIHIEKQLNKLENDVVLIAQDTLELIVNHGLQFEDFSSSYLPKHFEKLVNNNLEVSFGLKWQNDLLEGSPLYPKRLTSGTASIIDSIQPELVSSFNLTKAQIVNHKFLKNVYRNITPLSVLNEIHKSLEELKEEDNILLISEFNSIISEEINKQPVPFIYERIGEKFKHYFIDEFQDTSVLQWNNLIPLIDNALSGENLKGERGSTMLVGDAKQAIYRWRGGKPEQFIDLSSKKDMPLVIEQYVENLPANYRSSKAIVNFNNAFFKHISKTALSNQEHQTIYENCRQNQSLEHEGFVNISFIDTLDNDKELLYCENVLSSIHKALEQGYNLSDICIITRKTKEGIAIAEFLSNQNIAIVSSETLMLQNSPDVSFIIDLLTILDQPENSQSKINLLNYLAEHKLDIEDKHEFYNKHVHMDNASMFKALEAFGFNFRIDVFIQSPLYEVIEDIVRTFNLDKTSNAYIQFFLDEVFEYSLKNQSNLSGFLNYWLRKKDNLSIVSPKSKGAVQIMTIHKSKGLEFPVVIFPYANQDIYFDMNPKVWFPVDEDEFCGFPFVYINMKKELEEYGALGQDIYNDYKSKLELDTINLLYVVLTRAKEQLYVISELDLDKGGNEKLNYYSGLFINYLKSIELWEDSQLEYNFGKPTKSTSEASEGETVFQTQFISVSREVHNLNIVTNSGYLWDSTQEKAIEKGNLIHFLMSEIKTENDIDFVFEHFMDTGKINHDQIVELKTIVYDLVNNDKLKPYFDQNLNIYNERDILTSQGIIVRPDRIVIDSNKKAVIIDYKTGAEHLKHKEQLLTYEDALKDMDFEVVKKILVYINQEIEIKEF